MHNIFKNSQEANLVKIIFTIRKEVRFGQALYVCGNIPQLGAWQPESAFKLHWCQGNLWTGTITLTGTLPQNFEFKYIIADYHHPSIHKCEWELGSHNRRVSLNTQKRSFICDDRWNMQKINLNLLVQKNAEDNYYVVGSLSELGIWKEPKLMKKSRERENSRSKKQNLKSYSQNGEENKIIYSYSFYTFRMNSEFRYFYIRKGNKVETERKPGRIFRFQHQSENHPQRKEVTHERGQITINDVSYLYSLKYSRITANILVGSYPKSSQDLQILKKQNITAIFSIQSESDFKRHNLSPSEIKLICQEHGIKFTRYEIEDMNNNDFIKKAEGGVKLLNELLKKDNKVYIHCSAGKYRSPQMIALYLNIVENYPIQKAIEVVKQNHPLARPNSGVIREAIGVIRANKYHRLNV